jgi:hypothetical protein
VSKAKPFDAAAHVDATAATLDLPLDPAHRPGVIDNMERIAKLAKLVMDFPLEVVTEPLPLYRA